MPGSRSWVGCLLGLLLLCDCIVAPGPFDLGAPAFGLSSVLRCLLIVSSVVRDGETSGLESYTQPAAFQDPLSTYGSLVNLHDTFMMQNFDEPPSSFDLAKGYDQDIISAGFKSHDQPVASDMMLDYEYNSFPTLRLEHKRSNSDGLMPSTQEPGIDMQSPYCVFPFERGRARRRFHQQTCQYPDCQNLAGFLLCPRARSLNSLERARTSASWPRPASTIGDTGMLVELGNNATLGAAPGTEDEDMALRGQVRFCVKHAPKHSLHYSQLCCHPQCFKVASYEVPSTPAGEHDPRDLLGGMTTPSGGTRRIHRSRRSSSVGSDRLVFCASHAPAGVSDYRHVRCAGKDCTRQGIWVYPSDPSDRSVSQAFCRLHRHHSMVLRSPRRRHYIAASRSSPGGSVAPSQERSGSAPAEERRGSRSSSGRHRRCMHPLGCERFASYGHVGGKPLFCAAHKAAHDTLLRKSCKVEGCDVRPMFGEGTIGALTHCRAHRQPGHKKQAAHVCRADECLRHATFGFAGQSQRLYCAEHRGPEHTDVVNKGCQVVDCRRRASFGDSNSTSSPSTPRWCAVHANRSKTVDIRHARCIVQGCQKHPTFGPPPCAGGVHAAAERLYCREHKTPDSVNLKLKSCKKEHKRESGRAARMRWGRSRKTGGGSTRKMQERAGAESSATSSSSLLPADAALAPDKTRDVLDSSNADSTPSLPPTRALSEASVALQHVHHEQAVVLGGVQLGSMAARGANFTGTLGSGACWRGGLPRFAADAWPANASTQRPMLGKKSYPSTVTRWIRYCEEVVPAQGLPALCPVPATQDAVLSFISFLQQEGKVQADSLAIYLTAINSLHQEFGFERPAMGARIRQARKAFVAAKLEEEQQKKSRAAPARSSASILKGDSSLSRESREVSDVAGKDFSSKDSLNLKDDISAADGLEKRWTSYTPAVRWIQYCMRVLPALGLPAQLPVPATREAVRGFMAYLQDEGRVRPDSMNVYLSAINQLHRDLGHPRPAEGLTPARNKELLASLVVDDTLTRLGRALTSCSSPHTHTTLPYNSLSPMVLNHKSKSKHKEQLCDQGLSSMSSSRSGPDKDACASPLLPAPGAGKQDGWQGGEGVAPDPYAVTWRSWRLCGPMLVKWIRYCQQSLPGLEGLDLEAFPAVPASQEAIAAYVEYLVQTEHADGDSLLPHLSAINNLHQSLGYSKPWVGALEASRVQTVRWNTAATRAPPAGKECGGAAAGAAPDGEQGFMCSVNEESPCGEMSTALHAGGDSSPTPMTPIPPPLVI